MLFLKIRLRQGNSNGVNVFYKALPKKVWYFFNDLTVCLADFKQI